MKLIENKNKTIIGKPDGYKWLLVWINQEKIERAIFSDLTEICNIIGVSKSTLQRRLREDNYIVKIKGYQIFKVIYFKSSRGKEHINGKPILNNQLDSIIIKELI